MPGTLLLGLLAGHWRYAHIVALRVNKLTSEDALRRALERIDAVASAAW